jgi:hypothetical protein
MKYFFHLGASALIAFCFAAETNAAESLGATNLNRVAISYRMGFNLSAKFKNIGGYNVLSPPNNPQRTPNGDPWNYDNGYVYSDTTPNAHPGYTWYYGYSAGTPLQPGAAPTQFELYRSSSAPGINSTDHDGSPQHGLELTYNRQLGRLGKSIWGLEAGVSYMNVTIRDNRAYNAAVLRTTDTFQTGEGALLKPAPFSGNTQGPAPGDPNGWPLVGISPVNSSSSSIAGAAEILGHRSLDARMYSLRFGPYLDFPIAERWTFSLSGGVLLLAVDSDFKWQETVSIDPGVSLVTLPAQSSRAASSHSELSIGAYAGGTVSYALTSRWSLFAGAQFQYAGDFNQHAGGKQAVINLGQSVLVPVGISFSF